MMSIIRLSVIMLNVSMLSCVMLSVVGLNVIVFTVSAPMKYYILVLTRIKLELYCLQIIIKTQ
jgi:hypothetical protein